MPFGFISCMVGVLAFISSSSVRCSCCVFQRFQSLQKFWYNCFRQTFITHTFCSLENICTVFNHSSLILFHQQYKELRWPRHVSSDVSPFKGDFYFHQPSREHKLGSSVCGFRTLCIVKKYLQREKTHPYVPTTNSLSISLPYMLQTFPTTFKTTFLERNSSIPFWSSLRRPLTQTSYAINNFLAHTA